MHLMMQRMARLAHEVFHDSGGNARIKDGYTRVDPFAIAAKEGIAVILRPLDKLLGAFIRQSASGILINVERSAGLVHMTCAHELGHYFGGHETTTDITIDYDTTASIKEQEAEWFAYQLLVPRLVLATAMRRKGWTVQSLHKPHLVYQLSLRLGISYTATIWSLNRHKLLDRATVKNLLGVQPARIKRNLIGDALFNPHKEVWLLDESDQSIILEPRPEDLLVLRLKSHASSGYIWSPKELAAEGFHIKPIDSPSVHSENLSELIIGGSRTSDYLISPELRDACAPNIPIRFSLEECRPWTKIATPCASYQTEALFENLQPGLTGAAKGRLLQEISVA